MDGRPGTEAFPGSPGMAEALETKAIMMHSTARATVPGGKQNFGAKCPRAPLHFETPTDKGGFVPGRCPRYGTAARRMVSVCNGEAVVADLRGLTGSDA